jgi:adenosylhomocysteine nucleosidase
MESFTVLSVAKEHNLPGVAIRVITDQIDEAMPPDVDATVDGRGHVRPGQIVRYVAAHPFQLPALVRLGRRSRMAAESLATFLEAYIQKLTWDTDGHHPVELVESSAT